MSIGSQRDELLRAFGERSDIHVVEILEESKSAKAPGRPVFDGMLERIERGEAEGILSWHPDRLARNSVDGGRIVYLLDRGKLKDLKFSTFTFENNSQGKFMLSITFGYSKYYVDTLSENVKRGNRAKVDRGWRPGPVPLGYINDRDTRTIIPDFEHFLVLKKIFALMLTEQYTVRSILRMITEEWGYRTPIHGNYHGEKLAQATLYGLLANPFYAGYFYWNGQLYQGKHEPIVSLNEFQQIQKYLRRDVAPRPKRHSFPFTGLIRCGECNFGVTAEHKRNRYGSHYTYYHCTKRSQLIRCAQPSIDAMELRRQFREFLRRVSIDEWMLTQIASDVESMGSTEAIASEQRQMLERRLRELIDKARRLDDMRLEGMLENDDYQRRRRDLQVDISAIREQISKQVSANDWFEPTLLLSSFQNQAISWFDTGTEEVQRAVVSAIGSNFCLKNKFLLSEAETPFALRTEEPGFLYMSGCRESNPAYVHPMHAYCRYTTARVRLLKQNFEQMKRGTGLGCPCVGARCYRLRLALRQQKPKLVHFLLNLFFSQWTPQ